MTNKNNKPEEKEDWEKDEAELEEWDNMLSIVEPLVEKMKAKYPAPANKYLEGLEPALLSDITDIALEIKKSEQDRIVGIVEGMKKKTIPNMLQEDELFNEKGIDGVKGYNQALQEILTAIKRKEDE